MSRDGTVYWKRCAIDLKCSPSGREEQKSIGGRKNWPMSIQIEFTQCPVLCAVKKSCLEKRIHFSEGNKMNVNAALPGNTETLARLGPSIALSLLVRHWSYVASNFSLLPHQPCRERIDARLFDLRTCLDFSSIYVLS